MNLAQALEHANALTFPGFLTDDGTLTDERRKNEEAISLLLAAWKEAPAGREPFSFDVIQYLADKNRVVCDRFGASRLRNENGVSLDRKLSDEDLVRGVAAMQHRSEEEVSKSAGPMLQDLNVAYTEAPVSGMVMGIDIETTDRYPDRGYIINLGMEFMELSPKAKPHDGHTAYFGIPSLYEQEGVPLSDIHQITWADLKGKVPFREAKREQEALLAAFRTFPIMAHNAAFEDSWLTLHLNGYAEARKAGEIVVIDSRDICRRCDPEYKTLPHDSRPAALESWAKRRGVLAAGESERHLGLDDVDLMFKTVQAEFAERNMFAKG
ncbi:MAG: 3'-5' exonuclease [Olsenella sp.]|nr:3'-5' exonuclease [Olsenella sp.]